MKMAPPPGMKTFYYGVIPISGGIAGPLLGVWQRWDVIHYYQIAAQGYTSQDLSAFFPLFPWLGRMLGWLLGGNYLASLMILSNLALLLAMVFLYQMVAEDFSTKMARWTTILLITSPGAFYFYAGYSTSLMLLWSVLFYRAARQERWFQACCIGILAGLTHTTSWPLLFLVMPLVIRSWRRNPAFARLPAFFTPITPLLGTGLFLAWRISQAFPDFMALQAQVWGKNFIPLWMIPVALLRESYFTFRIWLDLGFFLLAIGLTPFVWKKLGWGTALYLLSSALFLASSANWGEPLPSFFRYILPVFPLFLAMGLILKGKTRWLAFGFGAIQLFLSGCFVMWIWIG